MNIIFCVNNKVGKFQTFYGTKLCKIEGCFRKAESLGYCRMHYIRIRTGILDMRPDKISPKGMKPQNRKCSVDNCENKHWQHGYCRLHFARIERTGSPFLKPKLIKICSIEGCQNKIVAESFCRFHYYRFKKGIPLNFNGRSNSGERNCNWKGGVAEYPNHSLMKKVRKEVLKNFGYKCVLCGKNKKRLELHHIDKSKDNHSITNLIILCSKCHAGFRKKYKKYEHSKKYLVQLKGGDPDDDQFKGCFERV